MLSGSGGAWGRMEEREKEEGSRGEEERGGEGREHRRGGKGGSTGEEERGGKGGNGKGGRNEKVKICTQVSYKWCVAVDMKNGK